MCGRFTLTVTLEQLLMFYDTDYSTVRFHLPRYNIAPGQMVAAVVHDGEKCRIGELQWGLLPAWAKEPKGKRVINARAETVTEKPMFKNLIRAKRCVIPASGFYEWKTNPNGKQPMHIRLKSGEVFSMAGLYDTWIAPNGEKINTCVIITTRANRLLEPIHHRMPVILGKEEEAVWLDRNNQNVSELITLLDPYSPERMEAYPVSDRVGNVQNDDPELVKPISR